MQNLRINNAKLIQSIIEDKIFFGDLKAQISEKDLPFVNMIILTALRNWNALNKILDNYLENKIAHKHRIARYLLILGMTELLWLHTAEYAVINETVNSINIACGKFMGGMANAILHKISKEKILISDQIRKINPFPQSFKEILSGYTKEQIQKIAQSYKQIAPLDIMVKENPQEWAQKLNGELLPNGTIRIFGSEKVWKLPGYNEGKWWVQDVAASLPAMLMGDIKGKNVADLCAAPGGKTAQLLNAGAKVTALDISADRLNILQQNMHRLGFDNFTSVNQDALLFMQNADTEFDAVLLDAPCSATGTMRRHPEVTIIKTIEDVKAQALLQKELLNNCAKILKIGGILVYSTCSIAQIEGEQQIAEFLQSNRQFQIIPIDMQQISQYGNWSDLKTDENGCLRTLPYFESEYMGMDSFFICKLQRII